MDRDEHRAEAVRTYNACWDLLDQPVRTADDDLALLTEAFASRYHWRLAGGTQETVIADWMASRAAAASGYGALAVELARRSVAAVEDGEHPAWLRASTREGLARAHAANGDADARSQALAEARAILAAEPDDESRALIEEQIAEVPEAVTPGR